MTAISRILAGGCAALATMALMACGGGASSVKPVALLNTGGGGAADEAALTDFADGFPLTVLPDSFLGAEPAGKFSLAVSRAGEELVGTIEVVDAQRLRALYCELTYDPSRYTPLGTEHLPLGGGADGAALASASGGSDEMLTLSVLDRPGTVHIGQVLAHWQERDGISGDSELARVRFAQRPFAATKGADAALPVATERPLLTVIMQPAWLDWRFHQLGDYNQDGVVGVSDLTPLGMHFGEAGDVESGHIITPDGTWVERFDFAGGDVRQLIDTSESGEIDIFDITAIGVNFGRGADSFAVYHAASRAAYSAEGTASVQPLAVFPYAQVRRGEPAGEQVVFNVTLPGLVDGDFYWVQPLIADAPGPASQPARVDLSLVDDFSAWLGEECFLDGGHVDSVRVEVGVSGDQIAVDTIISGYDRMRLLSVSLDYDVTSYRTGEWGGTWGTYLSSSTRAVMPRHGDGPGFETCRTLHEAKVFALNDFDGQASGDEWRIARSFFTQEHGSVDYSLSGPLSAYYYPPQAALAYEPASQQLTWHYMLTGDANQDTLVQIDDILMILRFYETAVSSFFAPEALADLAGDGYVSIADLTALGQNLGYHLEGYRVYMGEWGSYLDYGVGARLLGSMSVLEDAIGDRFNERLRFEFHVDEPVSGQFLWIAPYVGATSYQPLDDPVEIP